MGYHRSSRAGKLIYIAHIRGAGVSSQESRRAVFKIAT